MGWQHLAHLENVYTTLCARRLWANLYYVALPLNGFCLLKDSSKKNISHKNPGDGLKGTECTFQALAAFRKAVGCLSFPNCQKSRVFLFLQCLEIPQKKSKCLMNCCFFSVSQAIALQSLVNKLFQRDRVVCDRNYIQFLIIINTLVF